MNTHTTHCAQASTQVADGAAISIDQHIPALSRAIVYLFFGLADEAAREIQSITGSRTLSTEQRGELASVIADAFEAQDRSRAQGQTEQVAP